VEEEKADETINPEINPDILRVHAEMSRVISSAEAAGIEGDIDRVQVRLRHTCCEPGHTQNLRSAVGVQELVFIRLEELQKEKNAVLVRAPAHVGAVFNCSLFPHDMHLRQGYRKSNEVGREVRT
jgi:hypothetical protein